MENNINSLQQYIELFDQNRALVDKGSAPLMNSHRDAARRVLDTARLPRRGDEGFSQTSVNDMFAPDFGVNIGRIDLPVNPAESFHCGVPNMSTRLGIVANDTFHPSATLKAKLPEGVVFCSLREAALRDPDFVGKYYATVAPLDNPGVALNTLLTQDGVFIKIGRGVKLDKPLQLVNIFKTASPMLAFRRVLIVAEPGSESRLLVCDHTADGGSVDYLSSTVTEIVVCDGASFDLYDIEEASTSTSRYAQTFVRQHADSSLLVSGVSLSGGSTRNEFTIDAVGQHAETLLTGVAIGSGSRHIDNYSSVNHLSPRCHSRQLFKYALDGQSRGAFEGGIKVTPDAPFTEAYQSNRNVLASTVARMHTEPQLEIYNDEVKCSHGATTGQLDPEALFYMRTRGIPEDEARTMLMQAFMTDVIDTVKLPGLRERLTHLVEQHFRHCELKCDTCNANHTSLYDATEI